MLARFLLEISKTSSEKVRSGSPKLVSELTKETLGNITFEKYYLILVKSKVNLDYWEMISECNL